MEAWEDAEKVCPECRGPRESASRNQSFLEHFSGKWLSARSEITASALGLFSEDHDIGLELSLPLSCFRNLARSFVHFRTSGLAALSLWEGCKKEI